MSNSRSQVLHLSVMIIDFGKNAFENWSCKIILIASRRCPGSNRTWLFHSINRAAERMKFAQSGSHYSWVLCRFHLGTFSTTSVARRCLLYFLIHQVSCWWVKKISDILLTESYDYISTWVTVLNRHLRVFIFGCIKKITANIFPARFYISTLSNYFQNNFCRKRLDFCRRTPNTSTVYD